MKENIPDRPHEKARSDAVFAEAAKKAEKLSKKVLTRVVNLDIITNVVSGNGGIGRRAGLRIL